MTANLNDHFEAVGLSAVPDDNVTVTDTGMTRVINALDLAESKEIEWLAQHRVPRGSLTVMVGDEGIGKSLYWVWLVVALTTGKGAPHAGIQPGEPRHVLLFLAENGWADMDRPRLEVAGADLKYVHVIAANLDGTGAGTFTWQTQKLIDDMPEKPALIIADPWLDTVPGSFNVRDGQQAKEALRPWRELAIKHNTGVLLIAHTNRMSTPNARDKYGATAELRKTARMTLYAQLDDETGYLVVGPEKSNLVPTGARADQFQFNAAIPVGFTSTVPYLEHAGLSKYTAADLIDQKAAIAMEAGKPETVDARDLILDFLRMHNGTAPAKMVEDFWVNSGNKPSWRTVQNSRKKWGIETFRTDDGWEWFIPNQDHE